MATVLERFEHLGLAHNNKILMIVGVHISQKFIEQNGLSGYRQRHTQKEGEDEFEVWDYPEHWLKEMDRQIILFLEHYLDKQTKVNG